MAGCAVTDVFEILTAMALVHFQRNAVDLGISGGLGGRLDATGITMPRFSVIPR
jgi:folylpolyglutamate synthase/dihydropteroate synthase